MDMKIFVRQSAMENKLHDNINNNCSLLFTYIWFYIHMEPVYICMAYVCLCMSRKRFVIMHIKLLMVSFAQGIRIGRGGMKKGFILFIYSIYL